MKLLCNSSFFFTSDEPRKFLISDVALVFFEENSYEDDIVFILKRFIVSNKTHKYLHCVSFISKMFKLKMQVFSLKIKNLFFCLNIDKKNWKKEYGISIELGLLYFLVDKNYFFKMCG